MIAQVTTVGSLSLTPPSPGVSSAAEFIEERYSDWKRDLAGSVVLYGPQAEAREALEEVYVETKEANWDGYGALSVGPETYDAATRFLEALPWGIPAPEVSAEPDGSISFEWFYGPRRVISISVNPHHRLAYAILDGGDQSHGAATFFDQIPDRIIREIRSIIPS